MGGSGGGVPYFSRHDVETLRDEATRRLEQSRVDTSVNSLLQRELTSVNDRDVEGINRNLERMEILLGDEVGAFDRLLFGGSIAKRTYVDGLSDVDALVILSDESLLSKSPEEAGYRGGALASIGAGSPRLRRSAAVR